VVDRSTRLLQLHSDPNILIDEPQCDRPVADAELQIERFDRSAMHPRYSNSLLGHSQNAASYKQKRDIEMNS
jgi:hypothetical protein